MRLLSATWISAHRTIWMAVAAFLVALAVYVVTLAPGITWSHEGSDSGELAAAALVGGVPHPPGYPTYMLLAGLFARLPFAEPARGVNLFSALCAALAVALTALSLGKMMPRSASSPTPSTAVLALCLAAALLLAFSPTFWSQAVIAEVYALNALFAAIMLYLALQIRDATEPRRLRRLLWMLALSLGLGLGNHLSLGLLAPALGLAIVWRNAPRRLSAGVCCGAFGFFLLGLAIYLTLPLRAAADPPINWGDARTLDRFWWLVSGQVYRRYFFAFPLAHLPTRLAAWLTLLRQQFGLAGIGAGLVGVWSLFGEQRRLGWFTLAVYLPCVIYAIGYDTADSYVYLIPSYMVFVLWIGYGLWGGWRELARWEPARRLLWVPVLLCLLLPALPLLAHFPALNLSRDVQAGAYGRATLARLEPGALLLTDGDGPTFALWYTHFGLGLRPDVRVINVGLWDFSWYRASMGRWYPGLADAASLAGLIESERSQRAIYFNNPQSPLAAAYGWRTLDDLLTLEP
jgi:hypothetical protein